MVPADAVFDIADAAMTLAATPGHHLCAQDIRDSLIGPGTLVAAGIGWDRTL